MNNKKLAKNLYLKYSWKHLKNALSAYLFSPIPLKVKQKRKKRNREKLSKTKKAIK